MAKNGDIIDVMFGWMLELFGWIFKTIFKLIWWVISSIFGAIFGKKKQTESISSNNNGQTNRYSYSDCLSDIETAAQNYTDDELSNQYGCLFVNILVNGNMSIDEKCRLLEKVDSKIKNCFSNHPIDIGTFYVTHIEVAFRAINQMFNGSSPIASMGMNNFSNDVKNGNLKPMTQYIGEIMSLIGAINSPNGEFSMNYSILDKYKLPNWV